MYVHLRMVCVHQVQLELLHFILLAAGIGFCIGAASMYYTSMFAKRVLNYARICI